MDPMEDAQYLYVAELALMAPAPPGWTVHLDKQVGVKDSTAWGRGELHHQGSRMILT